LLPGFLRFMGQNEVMAVTVTNIRTWSKVDFNALDYPPPVGAAEDPLTVLLDRATEYVHDVTGRATEGDVPATMTKTYEEAIQRRVEQLVFKAQEDEAETAADFELLSSFGAGSYNESRRGMEEQRKAQMINPWPHLNDLLWRLATEDRRDEWEDYWAGLAGNRPAFEVTEVDWTNSDYPAWYPAYDRSPGA
jgi:hypothetical protein